MSTDLTSEGGHGAVPTGPEVPVEPKPPTARRDWPLYEVFVRGKRGLNHVHVGSLHAPDDEMAVHAARDLYTRRNEGVSIWVVQAADITASQPRREGPDVRPERRQGLPPPDVLRDPRERPPHVKASSRPRDGSDTQHSGRSDMAHEETVTTRSTTPTAARASGRSAPGSTSRWPASTPPCPTASTRPTSAAYCLMLGDDALVLAQRLTQWITAAPELEEEVAIGQHRPRPARPGPAAAGPRRLGRRPRPVPALATDVDPGRGRARLLPGRRRVPQHRPGRGAQRRLRAARWSGCSRRDRPAGGVRPAARLPRPGARRDRGQGRQRADLPPRPRRPLGAAPRRRHRRSRTAGPRPAPTRSGRCWPSSSPPPTSSSGWPRPASPSTRRPSGDEVATCSPRCWSGPR